MIKFSPIEFQVLQDNAYPIAEIRGLDIQILRLKGKRPTLFYQWGFEYIYDVLKVFKENQAALKVL